MDNNRINKVNSRLVNNRLVNSRMDNNRINKVNSRLDNSLANNQVSKDKVLRLILII